MSKYRITLLIHATAAGRKCHAQCKYLTYYMSEDRRVATCAAFGFNHLQRNDDGRPMRDRQCIAAERRAGKHGQQRVQLGLFE